MMWFEISEKDAYYCCKHLKFFFSSIRRHTRSKRDWSSDVCSSDLSLRLGESGSGRSRRGGRDDEAATRHVHGSRSFLGGVDPRLPLGGRVADGDVMAAADQRCAQQARLRLGASEHALGRVAADVQSERAVARPVLVEERGRSEFLDEPS